MELTTRKRKILLTLINIYIKTGEPVGSKVLCSVLDMGLSTATLRHEMSELCDMGYLEKPHTSAGRIPTSPGYRLYVSHLMNNVKVSHEMRTAIDGLLYEIARDPERITILAVQALAELLDMPSLSTKSPVDNEYIKRIELMPMGKRAALVVLMVSDGFAKSRICRNASDLNENLLNVFDHIITTEIIGTKLSDFHPGFLQTIVAEAGDYGFALLPLISSLFEMVNEIYGSNISIEGESKIYQYYDKEIEAPQLIDLITKQDALFTLLSSVHDPVGVIFGDDTSIAALQPSSMVIARYNAGRKDIGKIGVIGPTRMAYEQVIPSIEYFAHKLSKLLTQAMIDMED